MQLSLTTFHVLREILPQSWSHIAQVAACPAYSMNVNVTTSPGAEPSRRLFPKKGVSVGNDDVPNHRSAIGLELLAARAYASCTIFMDNGDYPRLKMCGGQHDWLSTTWRCQLQLGFGSKTVDCQMNCENCQLHCDRIRTTPVRLPTSTSHG